MRKLLNLIKNGELLSRTKYHFAFKKALKFKGTDEEYLINLGKVMLGYTMNLTSPKTFNEKINYYKLHYKNNLMVMCADKIKVDDYVKSKGFGKLLIQKYKKYNTPNEINLSELPNKFVLKTNCDSGGVVICKDKSKFDLKSAIKKLNFSYNRDYAGFAREWPYSLIEKAVFAEQFIEEKENNDLIDYKFFCFNGTPKFFIRCSDRSNGVKIDFFNTDGTLIDVKRANHNCSISAKLDNTIDLTKMVNISKKLSEDFPFARIDLYTTCGKIYFGEITFYPSAGLENFNPKIYDEIFGNYFNIDTIIKSPFFIK